MLVALPLVGTVVPPAITVVAGASIVTLFYHDNR